MFSLEIRRGNATVFTKEFSDATGRQTAGQIMVGLAGEGRVYANGVHTSDACPCEACASDRENAPHYGFTDRVEREGG